MLMVFSNHHLLQGDTLDLNRDTLGQLVDSDTAASWLVHKELLIDTVHLSEVTHVSEKNL